MKIERSTGTLPGASLAPSPSQTSKVLEPGTAKTGATQVQISEQVQSLGAPLTSKASSFDANKVESIRSAIADGRFEVNAESVTDGLLATVRDLIRSHARSA